MSNKIISYANEDDIYTKARGAAPEHDADIEQIKDALKARLLGQPTADGADGSGYTQVDLRPSWYKRFLSKNNYDISGPPTTSVGADVANAVGGAATEAAQNNVNQLARMPGARADQVARLQAKANSRGMLSSALGAFLGKDSRDFDTQQKRAALDASTLRKHAKTGASNNELLGYLNYDKTQVRNDELAQQKAIEEAKKIAEADKNSPESRRAQVTAVQSGVVDPVVANETAKADLEKWRPAFQQTQAQEHGDQKFDRERDRLEAEKVGEEERADVRRIETERREEEGRRARSFIPGHRWANDNPPPESVVTEARKFIDNQRIITEGAREMKEIQSRLAAIGEEAGRLGITSPAAIGQYIDQYLGDVESKNLLARANTVRYDMMTAMRDKSHLGVLQQFEKDMIDALNPTAGSIGGFFRGGAPWDAIADTATKYGSASKKDRFSLYEDGDSTRPDNDPLRAPVESKVRSFARPEVRRANSSPATQAARPPVGTTAGVQSSEFGVQPGDSLGGAAPVPPIPADARKPAAGPGMFEVSKDGKKFRPRALSLADQQNLKEQGFTLTPVNQ